MKTKQNRLGRMKRVLALLLPVVLAFGVCGCRSLWSRKEPPPASRQAEMAFARGDWQTAIDRYTQAIRAEGNRYEFYYNRAVCYERMGRLDAALQDYRRATQIKPRDDGRAAFGIARIQLQQEQWQDALDYSGKVLEFNPQNAQGLLCKGLALYNLGRYGEAAITLQKARPRLEPGSPQALKAARALAFCLFHAGKKTGDFAAARKMYMDGYFVPKKEKGALSEDDYYWAGVMAHVTLDDEQRDVYWSHLSPEFKKKKGIVE